MKTETPSLIILQTAVPKVINSPARAGHDQKLLHRDAGVCGTKGRCVFCKLLNTKYSGTYMPVFKISQKSTLTTRNDFMFVCLIDLKMTWAGPFLSSLFPLNVRSPFAYSKSPH